MERLRKKEGDFRDQMVSSKLVALEYQARLLLRRATSVHYQLSQSHTTNLFEEFQGTSQGSVAWLPSDAVRTFAKEKGVPFSSLLGLVGPSTVRVDSGDPYLLGLAKRQERVLRGMAASQDRLARELLQSLIDLKRRTEVTYPGVSAQEVGVHCLK